jgi:hypothetical protein
MTVAFLALQGFVVLFLALHDWMPLGRLNDVRAVRSVDSRIRLVTVTVLSTLPFAVCFAGSVYFARAPFPRWLVWTLWLSYGAVIWGALRAWWIPYLLVAEPRRAARYQTMFGRTRAFLPVRNGIRPNTLHVALHAALVAVAVLLVLRSA